MSSLQFVERLGDSNLQDINNNGFYHRQWYQEMINKETLKRVEERFINFQ